MENTERTILKPAGAQAAHREADAREKILTLAPLAVKVIGRILQDPGAPLHAQIQAIDIVLNRAYGKPDALLKLKAAERTPEESGIRIQAVIENIRRKETLNHE